MLGGVEIGRGLLGVLDVVGEIVPGEEGDSEMRALGADGRGRGHPFGTTTAEMVFEGRMATNIERAVVL